MVTVIRELPITSAPSQAFTTTLSGQRCDFVVNYSTWANRWSFDLAVEGVSVLAGRRIVTGVDLVAPFRLGLGSIIAAAWGDQLAVPDRETLPAGVVRLFHVGEEEE